MWWCLLLVLGHGLQANAKGLQDKIVAHNITLTDQVADSTHFNIRSLMVDILNINAPTSSHNNTQCRVDSEIFRGEALASTHWALRMYDASTKLPDGLLAGNLIQMGNFDECLSIKGLDTDGSNLFMGQYCLAGLSFLEGNVTQVKLRTSSFTNDLVQTLVGRRLQWSVCIPSSCSPADLQAHLQVRMRQLLLQNDNSTTLQVTVYPGNCYKSAGTPLEKADWAIILLLAGFVVVVILSTAYDVVVAHITAEGKEANMWVAFSLYKNGRSLLTTSTRGQMASVHGIKFLSMVWVVLFHKYSVMVETPNVNSDVVLEGLKYDWTQMPLSNGGSLAVNTFFVVSGLLVTFVFLREREAGRPFNLVSFYVYRYIRLTPIYAIVIGMYATVCYHLGSGPLWNATMYMNRENCRQHWWRNLLYVNNYQPVTSELCVVQSWYLAADTQLYWLSPLLLYPLWKWPKYGRLELAVLALVPIVVPFWLTYSKSFPWGDVKNISEEMRNQYFPSVYAATYTRAAPFLVGILLGYVLYETRKKKVDLPRWLVITGWAVSTGISLTIVYALHIYYKVDHPYSAIEAAFFASLHPMGWGIVIGWIIFACEKGYAGPVKTLLSWRMFQPLSKLSYSAYLVHFMVFYHDLAITRSPGHYDHYSVVHTVVGDLVFILIISALFALTFEMPVLNLDKLLLKPDSHPSASLSIPMKQQPQVPKIPIDTDKEEEEEEHKESDPNIEENARNSNGSLRGQHNLAFEGPEPDPVKVDITKM